MQEVLNNSEFKARLEDRQDQFAALLAVEPEKLRHLRFCDECGGMNHQWTDWSMTDLSPEDLIALGIESSEDAISYRAYLAESMCGACDGTGFAGGSFRLEIEEWLGLVHE